MSGAAALCAVLAALCIWAAAIIAALIWTGAVDWPLGVAAWTLVPAFALALTAVVLAVLAFRADR